VGIDVLTEVFEIFLEDQLVVTEIYRHLGLLEFDFDCEDDIGL
jgi:hypothetical protein